MKSNVQNGMGMVLCVALLSLTGCAPLNFLWGDKKSDQERTTAPVKTEVVMPNGGGSADTSDVLLTIDGDAALTKNEFDTYLKQVVESNGYFKAMGVEGLPAQVKQSIFDRLVQQRLIVKKAEKLGFHERDEFKKELAQMIKLIRESFLVRGYENELLSQISVDEKDIKNEYEKNKGSYIKVAGGPLVEGVHFSDDASAQEFYSLVSEKRDQFSELAKEKAPAGYQDFDRVPDAVLPHQQLSIPEDLRAAVAEVKTFPSLIKTKDEQGRFWVLHLYDKKDTVYYSFEEIKPQLEMMVRANRFKVVLDEKLAEMRREVTVDIHEDVFKKHYGQNEQSSGHQMAHVQQEASHQAS